MVKGARLVVATQSTITGQTGKLSQVAEEDCTGQAGIIDTVALVAVTGMIDSFHTLGS